MTNPQPDPVAEARAAVICLALAEAAEHDIEFVDKMLVLADRYAALRALVEIDTTIDTLKLPMQKALEDKKGMVAAWRKGLERVNARREALEKEAADA